MLLQFSIPDFHFAIFNLSNWFLGPVSRLSATGKCWNACKAMPGHDAVHVRALPGGCCHIPEDEDTPLLPRHTLASNTVPQLKTLLLSLASSWFNTLGTAGQAADLPVGCPSRDLKQRQKCLAVQRDLLALWQGSERKGPNCWKYRAAESLSPSPRRNWKCFSFCKFICEWSNSWRL